MPPVCADGGADCGSPFVFKGQRIDASYGPGSVVVADFNGDGHLDLALKASTVEVRLGFGDGTFQTTDVSSGGYGALVAGDVNRDGRTDLAFVSEDANTWGNGVIAVSVRLGDGRGRFASALSLIDTGQTTDSAVSSAALVDVNADGALDLVVANNGANSVSVLLGSGDGTFPAAQNFAVSGFTTTVLVGDLNSDGVPDLAVPTFRRDRVGSDGVSLLIGDGEGSFRPGQGVALTDSPVAGAIGDLDGDGRLDVALANGVATGAVLIGYGDGTFRGATSLSFDGEVEDADVTWCPRDHLDLTGRSTTVLPASIGIADLNGDGRPDLVAGAFSSVVVVPGNGDGTFQPARAFFAGQQPRAIAAADFNGDCRLDLAVDNMLLGSVSILLGGDAPGVCVAPPAP